MTKAERLTHDGWTGVNPVLFYRPRDPFGCLSQFSRHKIVLPNPWTRKLYIYEGGEWRFQALKGTSERDHEYVCAAETATEAKFRGSPKGNITFRDDWGNSYGDICWYVMLEVCIAKALQHPEVQQALADTGERPIYEDSPTDDIWGWRKRHDYRGKNLLGEAWMQTRAMIV